MTYKEKLEAKKNILSGFLKDRRMGTGCVSVTVDGVEFRDEWEAESYLYALDRTIKSLDATR